MSCCRGGYQISLLELPVSVINRVCCDFQTYQNLKAPKMLRRLHAHDNIQGLKVRNGSEFRDICVEWKDIDIGDVEISILHAAKTTLLNTPGRDPEKSKVLAQRKGN